MSNTILSIMMLAAIALLLGAVATWRKAARKQALLMALLALIIAGNVAVWVVPGADGTAPVNAQLK